MKKLTLAPKYSVPLLASLLLATVALVACSQGSSAPTTPAKSTNIAASGNLDDLGELDKGKNPGAKKEPKFQTIQPKNGARKRAPDNKLSKRVSGKIDNYSDSEEGTTVSGFTFESGTDTTGDGAINERGQASLAIAGLGEHKVVLEQENFPVMTSKDDQVTVKDETSGNIRVYSADQDLFRFSVKDGGAGINIETLPDGTWMINGEAAATTEAAAKLAMKSPIIADASLHGLMLVYQTLKQDDKIPVQLIVETLTPYITGNTGVAISFGDPKPLLKAVIKLKRDMNKTGK